MQHATLTQSTATAFTKPQTTTTAPAALDGGYAKIGKVTPLTGAQQTMRFGTRCG